MSLDQVSPRLCFEAVRNRSRPVALFVGAGCSKSAGIELASRFVEIIEEKYPDLCKKKAKSREFSEITGLLSEDQWIKLFWDEVKDARVNLAHLCLGELVKQEIVDRVLTTNFDSLVNRACVLADAPIAVCDCVAMPEVARTHEDRRPTLYHLHGQASGMGMLNSKPDLQKRASFVQEIVRRTVARRILIVCGYSGVCDDVLGCLRDEGPLRNPVFWVPFGRSDVDTINEQFPDRLKEHFYVLENRDADRFFFDLLRDVGRLPSAVANECIFKQESIDRIKFPPELKDWLSGEQSQPPAQEANPLAALTAAPPAEWT